MRRTFIVADFIQCNFIGKCTQTTQWDGKWERNNGRKKNTFSKSNIFIIKIFNRITNLRSGNATTVITWVPN